MMNDMIAQRRSVTVLKELWKEEEFSYKGNFYELHHTHLSPKPVQKQGIKNLMQVVRVSEEKK